MPSRLRKPALPRIVPRALCSMSSKSDSTPERWTPATPEEAGWNPLPPPGYLQRRRSRSRCPSSKLNQDLTRSEHIDFCPSRRAIKEAQASSLSLKSDASGPGHGPASGPSCRAKGHRRRTKEIRAASIGRAHCGSRSWIPAEGVVEVVVRYMYWRDLDYAVDRLTLKLITG